jgi:L-cysteate sulfo-lyase
MATALATLRALPIEQLARHSSPVDRLDRLRAALGPNAPTLLVKRDDLLTFGMGGNKVRKLQAVMAEALKAGATHLITCGGVQSNHCRATAAAGAVHGLKVTLVVNGPEGDPPTGNARLDRLFGAEVVHVPHRDDRAPTMARLAAEIEAAGGTPYVIPLGASTVIGACGFARGVEEVLGAGVSPTVIVHASSSGGTQAGLIAGCALFGLDTRMIGISADETTSGLTTIVTALLAGMRDLLGASEAGIGLQRPIVVHDEFVGDGYGVPTPQSVEALELMARTEGIVLDPVYTSKAMAGLIALIRRGHFSADERVLFWHTGGQPGLFA